MTHFLKVLYFSAIITLGIFTGIETASLRFYHGSLYNYTATPLEKPQQIMPYFNKSLVSMFFIFGYNETAESADVTLIVSTYLSTGYTNVILVDWSEEARLLSPELDEFSYIFRAVPNTRIVGRRLGQALLTYNQNGINVNRTHLVGHSLGAHVAGYAGAMTKENNQELARITGLDPAGPMFDGPLNKDGLNSLSAAFVDVVHTDPCLYGNKKPLGSVDFWANCELVQPGCPDDVYLPNKSDTFCSHWRSYLYFAEALQSPKSFPAVRSDSCTSWQNQSTTLQIIYLGDLVDKSARGNYFFSTNSQAPFARGQAGLVPNNRTTNRTNCKWI